MTKVLIAGTFDIIHPGHINLIKQTQTLGDFIVIVIGRDQNVFNIKGRKPYYDEKQRLENLNKLISNKIQPPRDKQSSILNPQSSNNYKIILGDLKDPYKIIKQEKPDIVALGYDQQTYVSGLQQLLVNSDLSFKTERLAPFKEDVCKGKNLREAVENIQSGFLLIDKPMSWTSHDVVAKLRSITGIKQIGHTGTLDPFATGLLICAVSQATKMVEIFNVLPKTYEATIRLSCVSDTYDRTGKITKSKELITKQTKNQKSEIQTILQSFIGKQQQLPPMFSAKKIQGQKLYELARKGEEVERKPSNIEIYSLEFLGIRNKEIRIMVKCSTGTYIRTLAHDIGQKLGTGAILEELKRTAIGDFNVNQAVQLNQLTKDNYSRYLIRPLEILNRLNKFYIQNFF